MATGSKPRRTTEHWQSETRGLVPQDVPKTPMKEIPASLNELHRNLEDLLKEIVHLDDRLTTVLSPPVPQPQTNEKVENLEAPLARDIRSLTSVVNQACYKVAEISGRVQV